MVVQRSPDKNVPSIIKGVKGINVTQKSVSVSKALILEVIGMIMTHTVIIQIRKVRSKDLTKMQIFSM